MTTLTSRGTALRLRTHATLGAGAVIAALVLSFAWFIYLTGASSELPPHADGIVIGFMSIVSSAVMFGLAAYGPPSGAA